MSDTILDRIPEIPNIGPRDPQVADKSFDLKDIPLANLTEEQKLQVLKMLEPFSDMWQGQIAAVNASKHRIENFPGSKPFR